MPVGVVGAARSSHTSPQPSLAPLSPEPALLLLQAVSGFLEAALFKAALSCASFSSHPCWARKGCHAPGCPPQGVQTHQPSMRNWSREAAGLPALPPASPSSPRTGACPFPGLLPHPPGPAARPGRGEWGRWRWVGFGWGRAQARPGKAPHAGGAEAAGSFPEAEGSSRW